MLVCVAVLGVVGGGVMVGERDREREREGEGERERERGRAGYLERHATPHPHSVL